MGTSTRAFRLHFEAFKKMSFGLDLNQAIKNVQVAKAAHKSFKAAARVGVSEAEADAICVGPDCDGYDVLRNKVDECLEGQIDLKQKLNAAEAAGNLAATASVSEEMATLNTECSQYFEQEALGHGPVHVPRNRPSSRRAKTPSKRDVRCEDARSSGSVGGGDGARGRESSRPRRRSR